jgi:hypothetical protein
VSSAWLEAMEQRGRAPCEAVETQLFGRYVIAKFDGCTSDRRGFGGGRTGACGYQSAGSHMNITAAALPAAVSSASTMSNMATAC